MTSCGSLLSAHCHDMILRFGLVWFVSLKEEITLLQQSHTLFIFHRNPISTVDNYLVAGWQVFINSIYDLMGQLSRRGLGQRRAVAARLALFPYGETQILQPVLDGSERQHIYKSQRTGWSNRKVHVAHERKAQLQGAVGNYCYN